MRTNVGALLLTLVSALSCAPGQLLSDPESRTIDAYGLRDPAYAGKGTDGIPHPAVYVIDKSGRVAWARIESDYKKRPTNDEIRAALDALKE